MKILILGIGNAQTDLLRLLAGKHEIHAISNTPEGRGRALADFFELIDIRDQKLILEYAQRHQIDLICSTGSDIAMVSSAVVSEKLDLPVLAGSRIANICHEKHRLREHLSDFHGNLHYHVLEDPDDISGVDTAWPLIIKPVDSQGQRGVFLVQNESELRDKFAQSAQFSRSKRIIAEEYIDGPEISVNCYFIGGSLKFFIISDRIAWPDFPGGIIRRHVIPSAFTDTIEEEMIREFVQETANRLCIVDGPLYLQIKIGHSGPRLIEATPRLDGCHLWRLIRYATGIDLLEIYSDHLINRIQPAPEMGYKLLPGTWILEFLCEKPGTVVVRSNFKVEGEIYLEWYYETGEIVKPMNYYMEKCGYFISWGYR